MTILVHATHAYGHKSYASREITTGRFEPLDLLCGDRRGEKCHPGGRPASVPEACEQVREAVSIGHSQIAVPGRCRQEQTMERGLKWGIRFPDKGEVGGSSPPRPTIQITSKYTAISTFRLFENLPLKTDLSTICQLPEQPNT